ncbi:MAG: hypothetical protein M1812_007760 [Candelaria pacifica]|nr:MAG: hypothetical protein M1812_007760 [Candelaria pacifica]
MLFPLLVLQILLSRDYCWALIEASSLVGDDALVKRVVGDPVCNSDYGIPLYSNCLEAMRYIPDNPVARPDRVSVSPVSQALTYDVALPKSWLAGNCVISVTIAENERDVITWDDVRTTALGIINFCIRDSSVKFGGRQLTGVLGKVEIVVAEPRSRFEKELALDEEARVINCQEIDSATLLRSGKTICTNMPSWAEKGCRTKYCSIKQATCCEGYDCAPQDQPGLMEILFGAALSAGIGGCMAPISSLETVL